MRIKFKKLEVDSHNGWRAYWWKGHESKETSVCIIEIDPGKSLDHIHLLPEEFETEVILDGEATYSGSINTKLKSGDVVEQRGKSGLIKIQNRSNKPLRILCINKPPWQSSHETIFTK